MSGRAVGRTGGTGGTGPATSGDGALPDRTVLPEACDLPRDRDGYQLDVLVVGAGVLGCFTARALAGRGLRVAVVERELDVCSGISSANTAIVYSGALTRPGTLKSELCVRANRGFDGLCAQLGVRFERCGFLMVTTGADGRARLERFLRKGRENGVEGLELLDGEQARRLQPGLSEQVVAALWDPMVGTVIPWELGLAAAREAADGGVSFLRGTRVCDLTPCDGPGGAGGFTVDLEPVDGLAEPLRRAVGQPAGPCRCTARMVVDCAGLDADHVLEMVGEARVRIVPRKGEYRLLDIAASGFLRHVVVHEPEGHAKGITFVPTIEGNVLIGPTEGEAASRTDRATTAEGLAWLDDRATDLMPQAPLDQVIRSFATIRPTPEWTEAEREGESIDSFVIVEEPRTPGFIGLIGVKTPGLTCADELGRLVAGKVLRHLDMTGTPGASPGRPSATRQDPLRPAARPRIADLDLDARAELVAHDPAFGRVVCRCGEVTEGEVRDALRCEPRPVTLDGLKRRVGTGLGRCQGSFCTQQVLEMMAEHLGVDPAQVPKDRPGSQQVLASGMAVNGRTADAPATVARYARSLPAAVDVLVVGGGGAGCAAALGAVEGGAGSVIVLERAPLLGGILDQCTHDGFGTFVFEEDLSGVEFADRLVGLLTQAPDQVVLSPDTTVLALRSAPQGGALVTVSGPTVGVRTIAARSVVLASGSRERPLGTLPVSGTRPAGVLCAGAVQRMLDLGGYRVGHRAVVLGSGDVGLIVARRLSMTGCAVECVVEQADHCGGLAFNQRRCLDVHGIPLLLHTTVTAVHGSPRVESVTLSDRVDGSTRELPCDLLVTSLGLVPERELLDQLVAAEPGVPHPWLSTCGNAEAPYALVDTLVEDSREVGRDAARGSRLRP